ncbi:MAG: DUF5076 domain-containing protein [Acidobacteriaceae bacterium]
MAPQKFLDPPPAAQRDKAAFELLRVWIAEEGQHVSLRAGVWDDPAAWGMMLADLARHIVNAHAQQNKKLNSDAFLQQLREGFDEELDNPTEDVEGDVS